MPRSTQAERLDERAGEVAHVIGQRQHGVRDVLARGGRQLAEPARLERAGDEGGAERLVAREAERAVAAGHVMGERDAHAGRQRSVDDDARDLVAEHRAGGPRRPAAASRRRCRTVRTRARARGSPPGGAVGEGSSRSAGDPPGVTVTASMSAQSLVAEPGAQSGRLAGPARRPARPRPRPARAVRRGRPRAERPQRPTRSRAASRSASQNTGSGSSEPSGATPPIAKPVYSRTRAASARAIRPPASAASRASSRRLSPATSASTGRSSHRKTSDLTICPTPAPTAAAASTAVRAESASRRWHSRDRRHAARCARARGSSVPRDCSRRTFCAQRAREGVRPSGGAREGVGVLGREHRPRARPRRPGRTACRHSGEARAAPRRRCARARTAASASSPRTCRPRRRCAPRPGSRIRSGRRDSPLPSKRSWWWRIARTGGVQRGDALDDLLTELRHAGA